MEQHSGKLVLAILQGEDYEDTVYELNQNGFFVTMLSSTGGFLKKHSTTIMIGVEEPRLDEVLDILKRRAGQRKATVYPKAAHGGANSCTRPPEEWPVSRK